MLRILTLLSLIFLLASCTNTKTEEELRKVRAENVVLHAQLDSLRNGPSNMYVRAIDAYNSNQLEQSKSILESLKQRYPQWQPEEVSKKLSNVSDELHKITEEKQKMEAALNKYVTKSFDSFQKITWYETTRNTSKQIESYRTFTVELYFGINETGSKLFRLRTKYLDEQSDYHDTQWIFYEAVQLLGDDGTQLTIKTDYPEKQSDNGSYGLKEWSDNLVDESTVLKLANCKSINVRFQGKYSYDFRMTPNQLNAFKEIVQKSKTL